MRLCSWNRNYQSPFAAVVLSLLTCLLREAVTTSGGSPALTTVQDAVDASRRHRRQSPWTLSALNICSRIPGLTSTQATLCRLRPDLMVAISKGAQLGQMECRKKFQWQRWNCSSTIDTALAAGIKSHPNKYFSNPGSREVAFLYSITSAGVVYTVSQWCSRGMLRHCGCDKRHPKANSKKGQKYEMSEGGKWKWGGCSVDVRYGIKIARLFLDSKETRLFTKDQYSLVNMHNNKAGRKAVLHNVRFQCKCHGVSGSCSLRTCWRTLPSFGLIGDHLIDRYRKAKMVEVNPKYKISFAGPPRIPLKRFVVTGGPHKGKPRAPRPRDIVYSEKSPDYCQADKLKGTLGTQGRGCRKSQSREDEDSCHFLCCGRGYDTHLIKKTWQCNCKFHWCCSVHCNQCTKMVHEYTCK